MPMNKNTAELKRMMKANNWSVEDVCKMLPINGKPRSYHTVYAWITGSQPRVVTDDCLSVLRLTVKLQKKS